MNKKIFIWIALIAIVCLAVFLRLYLLASYPNGFNADEAALGYNAYSLLKTGHDEHGFAWPVVFQSFGDYKAGLYVYIIMPFVALMGLTEWAIRLPSALFGVGTVFLLYFLVKKIFNRDDIALLASFFLAISPWHLQFSRGGWEVNVATFFITLGIYTFLKGLERPKWFYVSLISFLASLYTYQSPKVVVPLLGIGLIVLYAKKLWQLKKSLILPIIVVVILSVPLVVTFTSKSGYARFSGVSIFADTGPFWATNQERGEYDNPNAIVPKLLHNKIVGYGLDFLKNYSDHYTPHYLFFAGDIIDRNNIPETGVMYIADGIFVILGLLFVLKTETEHKKALLFWLVVAPTAAAITFQTPHALRSHNMVIPLVTLAAAGVVSTLNVCWRMSKLLALITAALVIIGYGYCFTKYLHEYYVHIPQHLPFANNYGFDQLVPYVESVRGQYNKVVVTDRYDQPYILFLFFSQKDPASFQPQSILTPRDKFGFSTVRAYDNYEFRPVTQEDLRNDNNTLIIGSDKEIPDNDPRIIKIINFPNGTPAFKILKT